MFYKPLQKKRFFSCAIEFNEKHDRQLYPRICLNLTHKIILKNEKNIAHFTAFF